MKGMPRMSKQVRLVVGEGENKKQIGIAEVQTVPNGDSLVSMTVTDPEMIKALGGNQIQGTIPRIVDVDPDEVLEETDE